MTPVSLQPIAFTELTGWAEDDHLAAFKAFLGSCARVIGGKAGGKPDDPVAAHLTAACRAAQAEALAINKASARAFFEREFQPHRVIHQGTDGLLTAYYEPVIEGSRQRQGRFQTPILKRPADLVTVVPETRAALPGSLTHARRTAAGLVPFATRAEIDGGALKGHNLELVYLADPVDLYFLQIQGSGRIRLEDGSSVRVQYDGKNGHPYTSIGRYLIDKGLLAADKMSMGAIGKWLKADIERARHVLNQNASYVFFKELPATADGPLGAIDVPLFAGRSVAIDPGVHRLGSPVYVSASNISTYGVPTRAFHRLMVAHDVGGAIRGPERVDLYFGSGEAAEREAGGVRHPGNVFPLLPRGAPSQPVAEEARGAPRSR